MKRDFENFLLRRMSSLFGVLADNTRLKIMYSLLDSEKKVGEIASIVGMSVSATSHQLKVLRENRLVKKRRQGRENYYSLDDFHIPALLALAGEHCREEIS